MPGEPFDHFGAHVPAAKSRPLFRSQPSPVISQRRIRAGEQQNFGAFGPPLKGCLHQRRETRRVPRVHLDLRTPLEQYVQTFRLPGLRGEMKRRVALVVGNIRIRPFERER